MNHKDPLATVAAHQQDIAFELLEADATITHLHEQHNLYQVVHSLVDAAAAIAAGRIPHWPHAPSSEQFTTRNGSETIYLYLYWSRARHGGDYQSPQPKGKPVRKTYIGCHTAKIDLARAMVANYRTARHLAEIIDRAEHALSSVAFNTSRLARNAAHLRATTTEALENELSR